MQVSVLSAFARLNLDPWQQAATLRDMPRRTATQRMAELIAQLPGEAAREDVTTTAHRLIGLLPQGSTSKLPLDGATAPSRMLVFPSKNVIIFALLATAALLMMAANREPPSSEDTYGQVPAAHGPPQTSH